MNKIVAIIPARYQSSRFVGKPLAMICDKPMIQWVYEVVAGIANIDEVYVATDDERIMDAVEKFNGNCIMTSKNHQCGSDRIAECVQKLNLLDNDIILNIQGDEPLIEREMIQTLIDCFSEDIDMATLKSRITDEDEVVNPNVVKVITNCNNEAIYFSRSPIPYVRDEADKLYYKHIGIYGYRARFLLEFSLAKRTVLEKMESLEQLRAIEMGYHIKVAETRLTTVGVDTPEQLIEVEEIMRKRLLEV